LYEIARAPAPSFAFESNMKPLILGAALILSALPAAAATDHYTIDSDHTYPSFEAPHISGISLWRGKIDKTSGTVTLDRAGKSGSVDITMDASSVDFGNAAMNDYARGPNMFDAAKFPTLKYQAKSMKYAGDVPVEVDGDLTLLGITKPVPLTLKSFKCIVHPYFKREVCGADAYGQFDRSQFGMSVGLDVVGSPLVTLAIQVEALKDDPPSVPR